MTHASLLAEHLRYTSSTLGLAVRWKVLRTALVASCAMVIGTASLQGQTQTTFNPKSRAAVVGAAYADTVWLHPTVLQKDVPLTAVVISGELQAASARWMEDSVRVIISGTMTEPPRENFFTSIVQVLVTDANQHQETIIDSIWTRSVLTKLYYLTVSNSPMHQRPMSHQEMTLGVGRFNSDVLFPYEGEFAVERATSDTLFDPAFLVMSMDGQGWEHSYTDYRRDTAQSSRIRWWLDLSRPGIAQGDEMRPIKISWNPARFAEGIFGPGSGKFFLTDANPNIGAPFVEGPNLMLDMATGRGRFNNTLFTTMMGVDTATMSVYDNNTDSLTIVYVPSKLELSVRASVGTTSFVAYPTVFSERVMLREQDAKEYVRYRVYDILGHLVRELATSGFTAEWDGRNAQGESVPCGEYYIESARAEVIKVRKR